jgi:hypothetical protein
VLRRNGRPTHHEAWCFVARVHAVRLLVGQHFLVSASEPVRCLRERRRKRYYAVIQRTKN